MMRARFRRRLLVGWTAATVILVVAAGQRVVSGTRGGPTSEPSPVLASRFAVVKQEPAPLLPETDLSSVPGWLGGTAGRGVSLLVLFTEGDCQAGLADSAFWNELSISLGGIPVVGVVSGTRPGLLRHFVLGQQLTIPVLHDPGESVFAPFREHGYFITPLIALMSPQGEVVHVQRSMGADPARQSRYLSWLRLQMGDLTTSTTEPVAPNQEASS